MTILNILRTLRGLAVTVIFFVFGVGTQIYFPFPFSVTNDEPALNNAPDASVLSAESTDIPRLKEIGYSVPVTFNSDAVFKGNIIINGTLFTVDSAGALNTADGTGTQTNSQSTIRTYETIVASSGGVLSFQGMTGDLDLTAGTGISINVLEITNSDPGSGQNIFKTIDVPGIGAVVAGTNNDTLKLSAGSGINLIVDSNAKNIAISQNIANDLAVSGLVVAKDATSLDTLGPGPPGYILESRGSALPVWVDPAAITNSSLSFGDVTAGTSAAELTIGNGSVLSTAGTGVINATHLQGNSWNSPGDIGILSPARGKFMDLEANGQIVFPGLTSGIARIDPAGRLISSTINLDSSDVTGFLPLSSGGTGAGTPGQARTNLGLGSLALENTNTTALTNYLPISGGAITGSLSASGSGNINATQLLGNTWSSPAPIGTTTPATGAFTTLSASGPITFSNLGAGIARLNSAGVLSSSAVNLAGNDITGILPLSNGGTGATNSAGLRTSLGLGTLATENTNTTALTNYLPISGGTLTGALNSLSVIPTGDNVSNLGSSSKYFANTYTNKLFTNVISPVTDSTTALQITKANGTTNILNIDTLNSRIGIGTTSPASDLDVVSTNVLNTRGISVSQINTHAAAAQMNFKKARGTIGSLTTVANNDYSGVFNFFNYDGTNYLQTAGFGSRINGTVIAGSVPTDLFFYTSGGGNDSNPYNNNHVRMIINSAGYVGIGTTSPTSALTIGGAAAISTVSNGNLTLLPNGTGYTIIGNAGTTSHAFNTNDDLFVSGRLEVDRLSYFDAGLQIQDSQAASVAAQIFNSSTGTNADGMTIKLGNPSATTVSPSNHFLSFETSGIGIVGSIQGNGGRGIQLAQNGIADYAEYMPKENSTLIPDGSLVCMQASGMVTGCTEAHGNIVGIASPYPLIIAGENLGDGSVAVGLAGIVETRVSTASGVISPGDMIAVSSGAGVGVKASSTGMVAGRALEGYNGTGTGKIKVIVSPQMYFASSLESEIKAIDGIPPISSADINSATISGSLHVLGRTVLSETSVTGRLSVGLLSIDGLDSANGTASASINTLSEPLRLQSYALAGVDILNGKVTIDKSGNLIVVESVTAKKYNVDTTDVRSASLGKSVLPAGDTRLKIETTAVTENSAIFLTPIGEVSTPLFVAEQKPGESFTVGISKPEEKEVGFKWFIVN